jgi:hypothetical protein
MTSKSARRARKRAITLAGGQAIPQPTTGRDRDNRPKQEDARATALAARERHTGQTGKDALDPALSTDLGRCIDRLTHGDERARLLETWNAISAAHRNYCMLYLGQTGHSQGAAMGYISEPMETDQSLRVDLRTHDERVASAKAAWNAWDARFMRLSLLQRVAISYALNDGCMWRDKNPTPRGRITVEALRLMQD